MDAISLFKDIPALRDSNPALAPWLETLPRRLEEDFNAKKFGDLPRWLNCLKQLPALQASVIDLNGEAIRIGTSTDCPANSLPILESALRGLHPWRKGPFNFFGIHIDTEWRSDWKWKRLEPHIDSLQGKTVLDVGCGSGYHCWRMRGAGAHTVVGIDPGPLFVLQFHAAQHYLKDPQVQVFPLRMEEMPSDMECFDTVFSMGLLYHRRSPLDHLLELRGCLKSGGQLVLETLVIRGGPGESLMPEGRYGKMGNVWFIPSPSTLESWLRKTGFKEVRCVDITTTSTAEQRSTDWMTFQSLKDFLDPQDPLRTIEGYPAPARAILLARKE